MPRISINQSEYAIRRGHTLYKTIQMVSYRAKVGYWERWETTLRIQFAQAKFRASRKGSKVGVARLIEELSLRSSRK
ncbi:hypothetical protein ASD54_14565 [Rhizobium sp. Root149]|jgi:hypothetical protein|nr:hypothetical protein ASD54_14565 [Rhizobium sp. Root149]KRA03894.1 hypothetical protein ASD74_23185 [Rhizobium sp. Root564]PZU79204.1 MAG: hypothetical protein DI546_00835 [Rhizobium sp.]